MTRLQEPLQSPAIEINTSSFGPEREDCFVSITRCHNIECAAWASRLVCQVEVTGLKNCLKNVYSGSVGKKIMGFI